MGRLGSILLELSQGDPRKGWRASEYIVRAKKLPNPTTQAVIDSIVTTRKIGSSPIIWNQSQEQQQLMSAT